MMPEIIINNKNQKMNLDSYRNLMELLPAIKDKYVHDGEFLSSISVNGVNLITNNQNELYNKPFNEISSIEINVATKNNILLESMESFLQYIDQINDKITLCSKFIKNEQFQLSDTILMDITETIHTFIRLVGQVHQNLITDSDHRLKSGSTIKQLEIHLLSVLKAVLYAKKKNDNVMLIDLLEHELKDNLTQWKISAIPQIKKLNTI